MFYSYGVYVWLCPSYLLGEQSHLIDPGGNFLVQWAKRAILFLFSNLRPRGGKKKKSCHKNMVTFLSLKQCQCLGKDFQNEKENGDITQGALRSSPCNSQSYLDSSLLVGCLRYCERQLGTRGLQTHRAVTSDRDLGPLLKPYCLALFLNALTSTIIQITYDNNKSILPTYWSLASSVSVLTPLPPPHSPPCTEKGKPDSL